MLRVSCHEVACSCREWCAPARYRTICLLSPATLVLAFGQVELAQSSGGGEAPLRRAHLEYLGSLRTIARLETGRAVGKKQRRFINYLEKFDPRENEWKLMRPMMSN